MSLAHPHLRIVRLKVLMEMLGLKEKFGAIVLTLHKLTFKQGWEDMNKKCRNTTSTRGKSTTCLGLMNGN